MDVKLVLLARSAASEDQAELKVADIAQLLNRVAQDGGGRETTDKKQDLDYFSTDDAHRTVLNSILTLLKNSHQTQDVVRVHAIKNPEVLEAYKENLRRGHSHTKDPKPENEEPTEELSDLSSLAGSDYGNNEYGSKEDVNSRRRHLMRRNAVGEWSAKSRDSNRGPDSRHNKNGNRGQASAEVIHFESRNDKKNRGDNNDRNEAEKKEKDTYNRADKDKDTWDMITKQFDNDNNERGDKHRKHKETKSKKGSAEDWDKSDLSKVTKWEARQKSAERNNWNDNRNDKKDKSKADNNRGSFISAENGNSKVKEIRGEHAKTDLKDDWKSERDKSKFEPESFWKPKHENYKVKDEWKPKRDSFKSKDNYKPNYDSFKDKDRKKDSGKDATYGMPTYKTTKDRSGGQKRGPNKKYVPSVAEYYPSKPRKQNQERSVPFKAFGRTSIPFVGKKGIYEE